MRYLPLVLALPVVLSAAPALANGRYPAAGQLVVDPSDPAHLVLRATYGVVTTRDGGVNWDWVCEQGVGYEGEMDPAMAITQDGTVLAGFYDGLSVTKDECAWGFAQNGLEAESVIDVSTEKQDPTKAVAITATPKGGGNFASQYWTSNDNGATWTKKSDLKASVNLLTVDVAPTNPSRVYASGIDTGGVNVVARSDDGGVNWTYVTLPGDDAIGPFISAIDPTNPDVLYVRQDAIPVDRLLVSRDAGATWSTAFTSAGALLGFALSPDGTQVVVGGVEDGVWKAPTATLAFAKISASTAKCLTWTPQGLYACLDQDVEGFIVGKSTDEGATFQPLLNLNGVCGLLACAPETTVGQNCPGYWLVMEALLEKPEACVRGGTTGSSSGPVTVGAGPGVGASGAGGGAGVGSSGASSADPDAPYEAPPAQGCGYGRSTANAPRALLTALAAGAAVASWIRRRAATKASSPRKPPKEQG